MSRLMTAVVTLTQDPPADVDPSTGKGPEWGKAAPIGLLVILLLGIATFFLLRSMNRRLKRVQGNLESSTELVAGAPVAADSGSPAAAEPVGHHPESGTPGLVDDRSA